MDEVDDYLREYFTNQNVWDPNWNRSGNEAEQKAILDALTGNEYVLDVGCGYHPFKGRIKNLLGIDKYNPAADIVTDMLDFDPDTQYDVVLALGSTNLFGWNLIERQLDKVISWCKPGGRIFMRVNPGLEDKISPQKGLYKWSMSDIHYMTNKHDLTMLTPITLNTSLRYTWTWQK